MSYYRRKFEKAVAVHRPGLRRFLTKVEKDPPEELDELVQILDKDVWAETNCLSCSNCCRKMTPTYTFQDMKRIAGHLGMTIKKFKEKWLYQTKKGEWMNVSNPCQFLNLNDNKCSIYAIRPDDCAGFPHLTKMPMTDYMHVHRQNVQFCPATFKMVEKLRAYMTGVEIREL